MSGLYIITFLSVIGYPLRRFWERLSLNLVVWEYFDSNNTRKIYYCINFETLVDEFFLHETLLVWPPPLPLLTDRL